MAPIKIVMCIGIVLMLLQVIARFFNTIGPRQTGQYGMVFSQHGMNSMSQFMGEGRDIASFSGEVYQHIWGLFGTHAIAKGSTHFPGADRRIQMIFANNPRGQTC